MRRWRPGGPVPNETGPPVLAVDRTRNVPTGRSLGHEPQRFPRCGESKHQVALLRAVGLGARVSLEVQGARW